jgi:semaphorin 3
MTALSFIVNALSPSVLFPEMLESNNLVTFEGLANSSAYHTFLLDEEKGRLVVGAKDHIFSFNLLNISRDLAQVLYAL